MVRIPVSCPYCQSDQVVKRGKTNTGKQRYRCQNPECSHQSFLRDPAYRGRLPAIKQQVIEMSLNGRGIRDTARVLKISNGHGDSGAGVTQCSSAAPGRGGHRSDLAN